MRNGGRKRLAYLLVGAITIGLIATFLRATPIPTVVWLILGADGLRHAHAIFRDRRRDAAYTQDDDTPEGVYVYEYLWAEGLRALAQTLFLAVGVGAVFALGAVFGWWAVPSWFETAYGAFFTAAFLYVQYLLWMNTRQGRSLGTRMREARTLQEYERERKEQGR